MSLTTISTDIVSNIMKFMDISELKNTSLTCKNLKYDSEIFSRKIKKSDFDTLIKQHTCKFCTTSGYNISGFCSDCYLHMCENCFTVRNHMNECLSVPVNKNDLCYGYMRLCHDYCVFKCHKCNTYDDRYQLFLNDNINFKTICVDCFVTLSEDEKNLYETPKHSNNENN